LIATEAPAVTNDTDEGYVVGSRWVDITNDKNMYVLIIQMVLRYGLKQQAAV